MSFENRTEILNIFEKIKSLPKVSCGRCGKIYRGREIDFICSDCKEKGEQQMEEQKRKNRQIQNLLMSSNIPKRYKTAIFQPKTEVQDRVSKYFSQNFKLLNQSTDILLFGAIGTGKTYISCAFAIELIHKSQMNIKYITE